ncbi:PAS domain-containing sensor histidine kinase [Bacteroides sp. 519]|uniref:sensor histidine kinase n=1 Tax=Bacteroides sp. 519 TaxID=2302937 RepID=UPI0013CF8CD6|nr:ATP-binding protein [Bacteroides sp. 519]NDV59870.1 hypothetical protein [Bacteroides sp. 519]
MRYKLFLGLLIVFLAGIGMGAVYMYLKMESKPLWILPGILVVPIIIYFFLNRKLIKPYQLIINGLKMLNEQDFSTRLRPVKGKEANQMIEVFNRMMTSLRQERLLVREKNKFLDLLIQASPQGIIILNFDERISDINPAGLHLLDIKDLSLVKGKLLQESGLELAQQLGAMKKEDEIVVRTSSISIYRCVRSAFVDQGFEHPFILIEELTRDLLRIEKESYERIIRMMSHEVNNSVGAIGSTLSVVSEIFRQGEEKEWEDVLPAVEASHDRCGNLAQFISNLAHVVRIPEPSVTSVSLNELVCSVDALTRMECQKRNIKLTLMPDIKDRLVHIDGIQFEQVLVNIVKNAYEAIGSDGEIKISTQSYPTTITIEDNGPGIPQEVKEKLFTPFFTTKSTGQGIGLMFVRDVLMNHGCKFSLNSGDGWTRFVIHCIDSDTPSAS